MIDKMQNTMKKALVCFIVGVVAFTTGSLSNQFSNSKKEGRLEDQAYKEAMRCYVSVGGNGLEGFENNNDRISPNRAMMYSKMREAYEKVVTENAVNGISDTRYSKMKVGSRGVSPTIIDKMMGTYYLEE